MFHRFDYRIASSAEVERWMRKSWLSSIFVPILLFVATDLRAVEIELKGHIFTLPDGFEIQLVAGPPLVNRPITADFDEQGRLYASDSSGSNDKVQEQLEKKPHRIVRLEDENGDGVFDKSITFADKMMFPEGTMWYDGSLYVAAPPSIWKLTDTDGDGVADKREEWFQGKTLTGCANDLHGPYLGPDGWIYWCKGAFAEQTYTLNGKEWKTKASHIFRCRPDGSGVEPVMTGGMDNPVDVIFMPNGDRILTNTFLIQPGNGQRDGLLHAIYGGVYGKEHGVLDTHPRTGELMPVLAHMGAAAPCGLTRYETSVFGKEYQDNLFACQFNKHKISRHVLRQNGASYTSQDSDFVVSSNIDFHPTDVLADADGSLLIVDTGGWYKLCCPTSQLHKPDILGGIYRVRKTGAKKIEDPRGQNIAWEELKLRDVVLRLVDHRPAVRWRATDILARRLQDPNAMAELYRLEINSEEFKKQFDDEATPEAKKAGDILGLQSIYSFARSMHWAISRVDSPAARRITREDMHFLEAIYAVGLWRDREAVPQLIKILAEQFPERRRLAAEALGRIGDKSVVVHLLKAAADVRVRGSAGTTLSAGQNPSTPGGTTGSATSDTTATPPNNQTSHQDVDRALEHSIIYALVELADPVATAKGLESDNVWMKRAALIALDQMAGGGLQAEQVTPLLASNDPLLRETAHWIVGHHAEWGTHLAGHFTERLAGVTVELSSANAAATAQNPEALAAEELQQRLVRFASNPTIQKTLADCVLDEAHIPAAGRILALRVMARSKPKEMPSQWGDALAKLITSELARMESGASPTTLRVVPAAQPPDASTKLLAAAVAAARELPQAKQPHADLKAALSKVAEQDQIAAQTRLDAMAAVAGGMPALGESQFNLMLASLLPDKPVVLRSAAANGIAKAKLSPEQLDRLTETVKSVGPLELDYLLAPFEQSTDEKLGLKLVASLRQALALSSLRLDSLQQKLAKYGQPVQQGVGELVAIVNAEAAQQKQRIEQLLPDMSKGDIRRGQLVFNGAKAACTACHRFGYLGGNAGPDLTRIGGIRNERDLLESILYPSLSFVRSYESVVIVTSDGRVLNGLIRNETSTEIELTTGPNQEARVLRADIDEIRPSTVSVMPAGLDKQLSVQELSDLVSFLKNAK